MELNWRGKEVQARIDESCRAGINGVMALCVRGAKLEHPFTNRTGMAEESIRIARAAQTVEGISRGFWGSVQVYYFKYLELGTSAMRSKAAVRYANGFFQSHRERQAKKGPPWRGGSWAPTLVPEAKINYPKLGRFIRTFYQRGHL